jgi:two-component system nitrogen regulation sensor histidine kinase NtrY
VNKKRSIFIIDESGRIIFYNGDLHEVSGLTFDIDNIIGETLLAVFDQEIVAKLSAANSSGYFDYKDNNYIFKRKHIVTPKNEVLLFLEVEGDSDENISFYSMLIHEIKNPLAAIRTLVQALSNHILGDLAKISSDSYETAKDYFSRLTSEIDRLNRLLTSVKYIAKHVQSLYISFDIIKVANNTIKIFENTIKDKDIKIKTNFPSEPLISYGDPDQFHQIFNNLLSNAIEAIGDSKGQIQFTIFTGTDKSINIEVKDEGIGIDKNDLGNIFKAFYTKKIGGMGIGLTVVKMIVKHYKGILDIESNIGEGTKVSIALPHAEKIENQ